MGVLLGFLYFGNNLQQQIRYPEGSATEGQPLRWALMTDICPNRNPTLILPCCSHRKGESELVNKSWCESEYQHQPCIEGVMEMVCRRGVYPFASCAHYNMKEIIWSVRKNIFTGCLITGGPLSLRMRTGLPSESIFRFFFNWREPENRFRPPDIREGDASRGGIVCVCCDISLGGLTDLHVFQVEPLMLVTIEMTSLLLMCSLMPDQ